MLMKSDVTKDFVLAVETFEPSYNQRSLFLTFLYIIKSQQPFRDIFFFSQKFDFFFWWRGGGGVE